MESLDPADDDAREFLDEDLRRLARRLSQDSLAADDLLQDAWIAGRGSRSREIESDKRWFAKILINLARKRWRGESRRAEHERAASKPERLDPIDDHADAAELAKLRRAIESLQEPYREVVELHYFDELSFPEIAERLGRSDATLRSQHARALEILRRRGVREAPAFAPFAALVDRLREAFGGRPRVAPNETRRAVRRAAGVAGGAISLLRWLVPLAAIAIVVTLLVRPEGARGPGADDVALANDVANESSRALDRPIDPVSGGGRENLAPTTASSEIDRSPSATELARETATTPRSLKVAVRDVSGAPLPLAEVRARLGTVGEWRAWTTDEHGAVAIPLADVPTTCDSGREYVQLSGYAAGWGSRWEHRVAVDADPEPTIEIPLGDREMRVEGRVTDARGAPLAGAKIVAWSARQHGFEVADRAALSPIVHVASTRTDGSFVLDRLARQRLLFEVLRGDTIAHEGRFDPRALDPIAIEVEDGATLSGTVRHANGEPAAGASVYTEHLMRPPRSAVPTDADGRFRIEGLRPGWIRAWATLPGAERETATEVLRLDSGSERDWDARLAPRDPLSVRIVHLDGTPAACADVVFIAPFTREPPADRSHEGYLRAFAHWDRRARTDDQGRVVLHPAPDRPIDVQVRLPEVSTMLPVQIERLRASAEEQEILLGPVSPSGTLVGRVLDAHGRPYEDAVMRITDAVKGPQTSADVDRDTGAFRVERLPAGRYAVEVVLDEYDALLLRFVVVGAGECCDIGAVRTSARSRVTVRWAWPPDATGARRYTLCQEMDPGGVSLPLHTGNVPPASGWQLFSGVYSLHVSGGDEPRPVQLFGLPPGCALEIESGPRGRFSLPVRIKSSAAASAVELRVAAHRAGVEEASAAELWSLPPDGRTTHCLYLDEGEYVVTAESSDGRRGTAAARAPLNLERPVVEIELR